jgi:hypothetical protein
MDYFGASVAGIGDVDGDGMEDMVVGALGDDEAALNAGAFVGLVHAMESVRMDPCTQAPPISFHRQ